MSLRNNRFYVVEDKTKAGVEIVSLFTGEILTTECVATAPITFARDYVRYVLYVAKQKRKMKRVK